MLLVPAAPAADVITDGDMEAADLAAWTHTDLQGTATPAKATDQSASGQSLKGTSQAGRKVDVEWTESQAIGSVNAADTVQLSLWWGIRFNASAQTATGSLAFDVRPSGGAWTGVWSQTITPSTAFQTGMVTDLDVSTGFATDTSYEIRLHFTGTTGNDNTANVEVWWDDVVLDVTAGGATTTVGNGTDPGDAALCPGDPATELDAFTLQTGAGTDSVTAVEVTFAAGTAAGLGLVEITSDDGGTVFGSAANPTDVQNIPLGTPISATTTLTPYKVRVTPKSHTAMPAPPGSSYAVTGTVSGLTSDNTPVLDDTGSATVTVDNLSPGDATWGTITTGDEFIDLAWTLPGDADLAEVVILRSTASIADAPEEGVSYSAGDPLGASTVVRVTAGTTFTDNTVVNGTEYWYKIFSRDTCGNYALGVETGPHTPAAGETTTVGDGTDPGNAALCPGDPATELDAFTLETTAGTDTVTAVEVTFAAGTAVGLGLVEITDDSGATVFGSTTNPADVQTISLGTPIDVTTTRTQYKVRVTPKSHPAMPVPPGATYAVTGRVSDVTVTNNKTLEDLAGATVTVDNLSPANAVWSTITPGDGQIELTWTLPGDTDFAEVVILRNTSTVADVPAEGVTYTAGNTVGASTVAFVGTGTSFTDTGVSNGVSYWYAIFARDTCGNYATGAETGPHTPGAAAQLSTTIDTTTAVVSSCRQITSTSLFTGDDDGDGSTLIEWGTTSSGPWNPSCGTLTGASPRQCLVAQLTPGTEYHLRATFSDADGVTGTNPQILGPFTVPSCGPDEAAPTVLVLTPVRDAVVSGTDRFKVQVFDEGGLAATDPVAWAVDGGALSTAVTVNPNYDCGTGCSIYELDLDTTLLANGGHYLTVEVTDAAGNIARMERAFRVFNQGTRAGGGGFLLRRTRGSQLCIDCHALPTHSSQQTSTKYGNWALDCLSCHTPHNTRNVFLVRESLPTPNSGVQTVQFHFDDRAGGTNPGDLASDNPGRLSFLGDRSQTLSGEANAPFNDGICEACHTRTNHWRNDLSGGDHAHNADTRCLECHGHDAGFMPAGGGDCLGCHGTTGQGPRRPVQPDFQQQSHHVGDGGVMGGTLTAFDCVVCHAEGTLSGGETTTNPTYHGGDGGTKTIDLKNADDVNLVFSYDKAVIAASAGAAANWNSGDAAWRTETSTALDPFCLTCHDSDGAVASFNATDGGTAQNPFGDGAITNNYDQQIRAGITNIRDKVAGTFDLDGDGIIDPPEGIYSRHAIRGQNAPSRYQAFQNIVGGNTMFEGDIDSGGVSLFTNMGTDELGNPLWNDTSVMGCADCHTVDGANGSGGNAHGSPSEYLLKDAFGGVTEGNLDALSYVCYRCHAAGRYQPPGGPLGDHTGNSNDWQDTTLLVGLNRRDDGKGNNLFAMACMNCHGGFGFGTIHGTSQVLGVGQDGASGTRNAYRFMNGASLRFYDPQGWTGTAITCYTLGSADSWGGCTQHNRGQDFTKPLQRPLSY